MTKLLPMIVTSLRRHYRLLIIVPIVVAVAAVAWYGAFGRSYDVRASFIPQMQGKSPLQGIAAQLGFDAGGEPGQSTDFYEALIRTNDLIGKLVEAKYAMPTAKSRDSVTLIELYKVGGSTFLARRQRAVQRLKKDLAVSSSRRTGIVTYTVRMSNPDLAKQVADRVMVEVTRFDRESRKSRAAAERQFVELRLRDAEAELRVAENNFQRFLDENKVLRDSPKLLFISERLQREVTRRQMLYSALSQSYEQAKIDEVRDTPLLTVVEAPEAPAFPRGRLLYAGIAGLALGLSLSAIGLILIALREAYGGLGRLLHALLREE